MNQTKTNKRTTSTLPSFWDEAKHHLIHKRDTLTPQLRQKTPKNKDIKKNKTKKTPLKAQTKCSTKTISIQHISTPTFQHQHSLPKSPKAQPTLSSTSYMKIADLHCNECETHKHQIKSLQSQLNSATQLNEEVNAKYQELKDSYQKKTKKYKTKNRLLKDELRWLKWILGQRKEFHQILEQLQVFKNQKLQPDYAIDNQDAQGRDTGRNLTKENHQAPKFSSTQVTRNRDQMQQEISILQQKVMQLQIKNEFLQKLKIKPQHSSQHQYSLSNSLQPNAISFSYQKHILNSSDCERLPLHMVHEHPLYSCQARPYQYSDEESLSREKDKENERAFVRQNCWNAASKQLNCSEKEVRREVESRYMSPLRQRFTEENVKESSRKKGLSSRRESQMQENMQIPDSRSKYCDSIKERSRLLGL